MVSEKLSTVRNRAGTSLQTLDFESPFGSVAIKEPALYESSDQTIGERFAKAP